jgi:biopolymer transport protein ExbD
MPEDAAALRGLRSEINIAPLVHVTMVLLIIFMAAAPLLQAGYDVSLPRPAAGPASEPTTVTLDKTGGLRLNGKAVERRDLEAQLSALLAARSDRLVLFDAEDDAGYADAVDILDVIRRAGGRIGVGLGEKSKNTRMHD